jgi:hypothetical protein
LLRTKGIPTATTFTTTKNCCHSTKQPRSFLSTYNFSFSFFSSSYWPPGLGSGHDAIQAAVALKDHVSELEKDLIDALAARHSAEARDGAEPRPGGQL